MLGIGRRLDHQRCLLRGLDGRRDSQTAYTASKGAVLAMTREIAVEYARKGIRCNALCPGPIETPLLMQLLSDDEKRQRRFVHIPMGRLGQAEELAKAALFLASDDSSYMTGASLIVDGGITAAYVTPEIERHGRTRPSGADESYHRWVDAEPARHRPSRDPNDG